MMMMMVTDMRRVLQALGIEGDDNDDDDHRSWL